jgi:STE24 endopeptidase
MTPFAFTALFIAMLVAVSVTKAYLNTRQARHVSRSRAEVPRAFHDTITLSAHQKAADYTLAKNRVSAIDLALNTSVLLAWTLLGGLDALNQWLLQIFPSGMTQQIALILGFSLIGALIDWPLSLYQTFVLEEKFGFNKMTLKLWVFDTIKSLLLGLVIGVPLLYGVLWFMAQTGSYWWLWTWVFWTLISLVLMVVVPLWIAPLFNKFKPLEDESLVQRVNALMQRCGFSSRGFFVMDGSKRSAHANAYFTGFGAAKRVVFFDTLLSRLSLDEVEAVLAHELGHFHHRHLVKRLGMVLLMSLLGFAAMGYLSAQVWFFTGLGVRPDLAGPNDALTLLLFLMVIPLVTFWASPLAAAGSRRHEFQADAYAAQHTDATHLVAALLKLMEDNAATLTPDPWYVRFYYSHPPALQRIERLNDLSQSSAPAV